LRQYFHCLGLDDHCFSLGLILTVLVLCLETKTVQDTRGLIRRIIQGPMSWQGIFTILVLKATISGLVLGTYCLGPITGLWSRMGYFTQLALSFKQFNMLTKNQWETLSDFQWNCRL